MKGREDRREERGLGSIVKLRKGSHEGKEGEKSGNENPTSKAVVKQGRRTQQQ